MPLSAGAAVTDISPPAGTFLAGMGWDRPPSAGTHDPLTARALVIESGDSKWALVSTDLIAYNQHDYDRVRERLMGADPAWARACLTIACSHNHSSPAGYRAYARSMCAREEIDAAAWEAYLDQVVERIGEAVLRADSERTEAEIGFGTGRADVNMNRWHITKDGRALFIPHHRELEPNGVGDSDVGIMAVRALDGRPLAVTYHYAMHAICVCLQSDQATADFPGITAREVEGAHGGVCMFLNGGCGNMHPREFDQGFAAAERVGRALADAVLKVLPHIHYERELELRSDETSVPIDVCEPDDPETPMAGASRPMNLQAVALGDQAACIMVPGEPYVEICLALKGQSPFPRTLVIGLANDFVGSDHEPRRHTDYFALRKAYTKHTYEPTFTRPDFTFASTDRLIETSLDMLKQLMEADKERTHV